MAPYPKPGPVGGRLIRAVVGTLRGAGLLLPITSDILCAISGGADSMSLAHLLVRYGRRVVDHDRLKLLHVNHGWRGRESDADARFVMAAAREWGIPFLLRKGTPPSGTKDSWEAHARAERKKFFAEFGGPILTAHHADDLAETVLWRILTGAARTHGGGIAVRHENELRPLLGVRKADLKAYLKEEGLSWREDSTSCPRSKVSSPAP